MQPNLQDGGPRDTNPVTPDAADPFSEPIVFDDVAIERVDPARLRSATVPCRAPVLARVTYATDGDTITVEPIGGASETVRLIGVNTPEVAHAMGQVDECYGPEARTFTRQLVGHLVWLTFDQLCVDPYMRTLAYVHVGPDLAGIWELQLLRRGLGRAFIIGRNRALETEVNADQADAMAAARGLWASCP